MDYIYNNPTFVRYENKIKSVLYVLIVYEVLIWIYIMKFFDFTKINALSIVSFVVIALIATVTFMIFYDFVIMCPIAVRAKVVDVKEKEIIKFVKHKPQKVIVKRYSVFSDSPDFWIQSISDEDLEVGDEVVCFFYNFFKEVVMKV